MAARAFNPFVGDLVNRAAQERTAVTHVAWGDDDTVVLRVGAGGLGRDTGSRLAELFARTGAMRDEPLRVEVRREGWRRALVRVDDVPGYGWATWTGDTNASTRARRRRHGHARQRSGADRGRRDRRHLRRRRPPGRWAVWSTTVMRATPTTTPRPSADTVVDSPLGTCASTSRRPGRCGPGCSSPARSRGPSGWRTARGRVSARSTSAPASSCGPASDLLRVETSFDNPCRDHRLRAWFPLPTPTDTSRRRMCLRHRRTGARGRRRSARATAAHVSLPPLRAGGRAHGRARGTARVRARAGGSGPGPLTLLRCTGLISGNADMTYRPWPAGPPMPAEAARDDRARARAGTACMSATPDPYGGGRRVPPARGSWRRPGCAGPGGARPSPCTVPRCRLSCAGAALRRAC